MISLYQFPSILGLPNASPFCLKIETYLRMIDLPYELHYVRDPRKSPRGKLPFIKVEKTVIADSALIIDYLKSKFGDVLDKNLDKEQKAESLFIEQTFSEHLYWLMVYLRWQDDAQWPYIRKAYFGKLPRFTQFFITRLVRNKTKKMLYLQGTGRFSKEEILQKGYKTLDALAIFLAEKKYFHGDELTTIDATAFAFLANIVWQPYDEPLKIHLRKHKNILLFCERMWNTFYPEIPKPFSLVN